MRTARPAQPPERWMSMAESGTAWVSVRDADLVELLLLASRTGDGPMRIVEWGSGRSTFGYTGILDRAGICFQWLTVEHDREFFYTDVAPGVEARADGMIVLAEDASRLRSMLRDPDATGIFALVFDAGELRPFERGDGRDRDANLDDYVSFPSTLAHPFDLMFVDGRKRRRCLLEAASLIAPSGLVVLHDGWRRHYQCAFSSFAYGTPVGDELWVGAQTDPSLRSILPGHAFERHADQHGHPQL